MNTGTLIRASLRFHWRTHLGVVLGVAVATAVLAGALIVGDSVRHTLRQGAIQRLGRVQLALDGGERFFRQALAKDLSAELHAPIAPAVKLSGTVSAGDGQSRANNVHVLGVDETFWRMGGAGDPFPQAGADDEIVLNTRLADQLGVRAGGQVVLRVEKPSAMPRTAAMASDRDDDVSLAVRLTVRAVLDGEAFGNFSLNANQIPPYNAFVRIGWLQEILGLAGLANVLLTAAPSGDNGQSDAVSSKMVQDAMQKVCQLQDAGLELRKLKDNDEMELRSRRIFFNLDFGFDNSIGVLTYLVNDIRCNGQSTPYSMVAAVGPLDGDKQSDAVQQMLSPLPALADDEIAVNDWLATKSNPDAPPIKVGDEMQLEYFVLGPMRQLQTQRRTFRVAAILKMDGIAADATLMPDFPGLADSTTCNDWKPGMPIDLNKIRKQDEDYWEKYRGTPKAFVNLKVGREMWANSFGNLTAIRFLNDFGFRISEFGLNGNDVGATTRAASVSASDTPTNEYGRHKTATDLSNSKLSPRNQFHADILKHIELKNLGLIFVPVHQQALAASRPTTDFGGLFVGMSVFLIVAALLLMGLMFAFGLLQRRAEMGTLRAVGWPAGKVARLFLCEALVLACIGGLLGTAGGALYAKAIIHLLGTLWPAAVGQVSVQLIVLPTTLAIAATAGVAMSMLTILFILRRQRRLTPCQLLQGQFGMEAEQNNRELRIARRELTAAKEKQQNRNKEEEEETKEEAHGQDARATHGRDAHATKSNDKNNASFRRRWSFWLAVLLLATGIVVVLTGRANTAGTFFIAGALLLSAGVLACHAALRQLVRRNARSFLSPCGLAVWNASRRTGRSVATITMLACGSFLVIAVGANQPAGSLDAYGSGTGGFNLACQSAVPIFDVPTTSQFAGVESVLAIQVHAGDEASCLNLNRSANPQLLGVSPEALQSGNFRIAKTLGDSATNWRLLDEPQADGAVPAIGDANTITWALGKSLGDTLDYTDSSGRTIKVRLVGELSNCVLQGSLIISQANFQRLFPDEAGYRMFLVRTTPQAQPAVAQAMSVKYSRRGLEVVPATRRLAELDAVEGAYLSIFQVLGGLGLLLGSAGLGLVVLRNVMERRGELALLRAVGFSRTRIARLVLAEHWMLMLAGLCCGSLAGLLAVLPSLRASPAELPYISLGITLLAVLVNGALWVWLATTSALRGQLLPALRSE